MRDKDHHHSAEEELLKLAEEGNPKDLLRLVNRAIAEIILTGQSYAIGTHKLTKPDLTALYKWRSILQTEVAAAGGNWVSVAVSKRR